MQEKKPKVTTTERKIGKVTYIINSSASEKATDTINKKISKLIKKSIEQSGNV